MRSVPIARNREIETARRLCSAAASEKVFALRAFTAISVMMVAAWLLTG